MARLGHLAGTTDTEKVLKMTKPGKRSEQRIQKTVDAAGELRELFTKAAPSCPTELASTVAIDIADLAEVANEHLRHLRRLLRLAQQQPSSEVLDDLLGKLSFNFEWHGNYHMKSLKQSVPKLQRHLRRKRIEG